MKFYLDTSVFGGYYDTIFEADTIKLFEQIRTSHITVVYSSLTNEELKQAPVRVRELINSFNEEQVELVEPNQEVEGLSAAYIQEGILTKKFKADAQHIALATFCKADVLVSWNFKHMVNFFRLKQYNSVNLKHNYQLIDIRDPREVILL
jgi:predicted nucleic acid-binding protein